MNEEILRAGKIAAEVRNFAKFLIKKDMLLIEIAEKIEEKIIKLKAKPAFPVNLSINEIAAHYTPFYDDKTPAQGLLKIDFGVHVDGWIADNAFSIDLENNQENKKLIEASEKALEEAIKIIKQGIALSEIGEKIQEIIESYGFSPIINLSGHSLERYKLHAGITIPNINDKRNIPLKPGLYAIEPFSTNGSGRVYEGKPSGIYSLINDKNVRSQQARKILEFIKKEYKSLPFCSRWIVKKFPGALFALKQLERNGNLYSFPQLIEKTHKKVAQSEHTILVKEDEIIVTTK